jgi:two-component sensor histidine kinase
MASDLKNPSETTLEVENADLRSLLTQAGIDAAHLAAKAGIDATEHEAAKRVQQLLLEELHHRVKNTLATVIAITSRSLRAAETLQQGRVAVESRLIALGRAHDVLLQVQRAGAKLTDVIHSAIEPFESRGGQRFMVQDISVDVGSGAVLPLAMSLNELCTNALKYGALSNDTGHVEIALSVDDTTLRLTWTEKGGPLIRAPSRLGFGSHLIGELAAQLQGEVRLKYEPAGLVYQLEVPVSALRGPDAC